MDYTFLFLIFLLGLGTSLDRTLFRFKANNLQDIRDKISRYFDQRKSLLSLPIRIRDSIRNRRKNKDG